MLTSIRKWTKSSRRSEKIKTSSIAINMCLLYTTSMLFDFRSIIGEARED